MQANNDPQNQKQCLSEGEKTFPWGKYSCGGKQ